MLCLILAPFAVGEIPLTPDGDISLYGFLQPRYESSDTDRPGTLREERLRITVQTVLKFQLDEAWSLHSGGTTGDLRNQHSTTVTVKTLDSDHGYGNRSLFLNHWELRYNAGDWQARLGRTPWAFWSLTDYQWDSDINPAGAFASRTWKREGTETSLGGAYYALPDGGLHFTGSMATAQILHRRPMLDGTVTVALQHFHMMGGANAKFPRARGNERDYDILQLSLQQGIKVHGKPFTAGIELFKNVADYNPSDRFGYANRDEDFGYGLALSWGENKKAGDWRLRYNYTHQEALAVNPAVSEDSFSRLGTSNYKGHDFRVIYSVLDRLTVMARYLISEEIVGNAKGDRFRIDVNCKF